MDSCSANLHRGQPNKAGPVEGMCMTEIQDIEWVLAFWQDKLGSGKAIKPTHAKPAGLEITTYFFTTERDQEFVLKHIVDRPATKVDLITECEVLAYLHRCGVPVAVPITTDDGQPFAQTAQGCYLILPVLPSDSKDSPPVEQQRRYVNLGRALAQLHTALARYPKPIESWTLDLAESTINAAIPVIQASLSPKEWVRFEKIWTVIQNDIQILLPSLPRQHIHGDCHGGNIISYQGRVSGFIDLDHLPLGPRIYDIAYLMADFAKAHFFGLSSHARWLDNFSYILAGYEKIQVLSEIERESIWITMLLIQLRFAYWLFKYKSDDAAYKNLYSFFWLYENQYAIQHRITATKKQVGPT